MNKGSNEKSKSKLSRNDLINNLIGKDTEESIFFEKYEKKLIPQYLNESRDKWLNNTASLIRFYNHCESKGVFKYFYKENSNGAKLFRELYNVEDSSMDTPSSRLKRNTPTKKFEFNFLDVI